MKLLFSVFVAVFVLCSLGQAQITGVPRKVSYQGVLSYLDSKGKTKLVKNGTYGVTFSLYDNPTAGNLLYSESEAVTVVKGVYSVTIGEDGTPTGKLAGNFKVLNWLQVTLTSGPETKITYPYNMPRVQFTSVPYALQAQAADTARASHSADTANYARASAMSSCNYAIGQNVPSLGGYIFYLDYTGCHGLVCAPTDQSTGIQWWNGTMVPANSVESGLGTGHGNTQSIVRFQGAGPYAAYLCDTLQLGGFDDWYLPSQYELNLMWINVGQGSTNVGGFASSYYWSSTEQDYTIARPENFLNGMVNINLNNKTSTFYVRAVRAF